MSIDDVVSFQTMELIWGSERVVMCSRKLMRKDYHSELEESLELFALPHDRRRLHGYVDGCDYDHLRSVR
jgi:hypothetical protein